MNSKYNQKDLEPACFYLRKSREDQEAEACGEGETLAKHKKVLFNLAQEYGITISKIFEEIVSGESLIHRSEMLELLKEVEAGKWKSVFCMDIDRLGRGKMQDQGLIIETFKQAKTKIITPRKLYDLTDEFDEEYTEFEAFMARKELKIITRRLQGGRLRSLEDGNYIASLPPYGYLIKKSNRKRYLVKNSKQNEPLQLIWKLYLYEDMGTSKIATELNNLGFLSYTGKNWTASSVLAILKNPAYAGITVWKKKEERKSAKPGQTKEVRSRPRSEQIWIYNTHQAYITKEEFEKVQEKLSRKYHPPYQLSNGLTNSLAGIIKCSMCGNSMILRPYIHQQYPHLICYNKNCPNKSSRFEYVENALIEGLNAWLDQYRAQWDTFKLPEEQINTLKIKEKILHNLLKDLHELEQQKEHLHDLFEKKIYDEKTYLERFKQISTRILQTKKAISETEETVQSQIRWQETPKDIAPKVEKLLDIYTKIQDPAVKNRILKSVLRYATYRKEKHQKGNEFTLVLYPILPK